MSYAEVLHDCGYPSITEEEVEKFVKQKVDTQEDVDKLSAKNKAIYKAFEECGLSSAQLMEGASRMARVNELQCHFASADLAPWPHSDCYARAHYEYDFEILDEDAVKEYRNKYGHDANLYEVDAMRVKRVAGIDVQWGEKSQEFDQKINSSGDKFELNLAKILCIYFSPKGIGHGSNAKTLEYKQRGMLNGGNLNTRELKSLIIIRWSLFCMVPILISPLNTSMLQFLMG